MASTQPATQQSNFDSFARTLRKLAVKHSIEKPILFNFVNLSTILHLSWYVSNYKQKNFRIDQTVVFFNVASSPISSKLEN